MKYLFLADSEDHITTAAIEDGANPVSAGTVLMLTRGMTLLKDVPICVLTRPTTFNQDVKALHPKDGLDKHFLPWLLLANKNRLLNMVDVAGHGTGKLNTDELRSLEIAFPKPREQQKIADCLTSLDEMIAAQGQTVAALATHKRGLMQQLSPREGETVPRLRFPEFRESQWMLKSIGDLLEPNERPIKMKDDEEYSPVTVKRRYGGVVAREVLKGKFIKVKSQFAVKDGDFLVSKRQIVHDACGLVPAELDGATVSNEYSVLIAKAGCDIHFFNYFSHQPAVSNSFLQSSVGIVTEKMLFKLNTWMKFEFLFPSIAEQNRIAACLSALDARVAAQSAKLDGLKTHKKGLMQQLFPSADEGAAHGGTPE